MFSALSQGSPIYLLDKTSSPRYIVGEVVGVSFPKIYGIQNTVDIKVRIDGNIQEFNQVPSINSVVSYNNGSIIISESKQGIQNEVEGILQSSRNVLQNIETYEQNVRDCEDILRQLNPQFARDKERDDRLSNLENRFNNVESKLDKIFEFVQK